MLITCKECLEVISDQAEICPRCGVPKPDLPYELERLIKERDQFRKEEEEQAALYNSYLNQRDRLIIFYLLRRKRNDDLMEMVRHHTNLANKAQSQAMAKDKEIMDYESKLYEQRCQDDLSFQQKRKLTDE